MEFILPTGTSVQRLYLSGSPYPIPVTGKGMWTTDTKKLYIGDGSTVGGILVGPISDYSELSNTAHTHAYSAITNTAHTHTDYAQLYTNVNFDRITATSIVTTGASIRTTSLTASTATANTLFSKSIIISGDSPSSTITFRGTGSDINITTIHNISNTLFMPNISSSQISATTHITSPIFNGTSFSATNYYCGSTNLASMMGTGGGVTDHGALTGLTDNDHPQYRLTGTPIYPSSISGATSDAQTTFGTFGGTATAHYFPAALAIKGTEFYIDVNSTSNESSLQFHGGDAYVIYNHSNTDLRWTRPSNGTLNFKLWGDAYLGNGKVFLSNPLYRVGSTGTNVSNSGIWFGSATTSNSLTYQSGNTALSSSTNFIVNGALTSTTFISGSNNIGNIFAVTGHSHSPSSITDGTFTGDSVFNGGTNFGQGITGKSAYFLNKVTGDTIICETHMTGGSMLTIMRSGSTNVILRMGEKTGEFHSLKLDQNAGGHESNFILSTGLTIEGPLTATTYSGITAPMVAGSTVALSPYMFGSTGGSYFGFGNHLTIGNSFSNTATTSTALFFRTTGDTKVGFELHKDTNEFKFFSIASPVGNWRFSNANIVADVGVFGAVVSATTYSGLPITKSITVPDPRATENITMFYLDKSALFTKVVGVVSGSSPSVTWSIESGGTRTGTTVTITGATTTSQNGVTYDITPNVTVSPNTWIIFKITATGGTTNNEFHSTIYYKEQ